MYEKYFKRSFDVIISVLALLILFPILIIIAILVKLKLGSPIIFKQERPGLHGEIFTMYKFRSMTECNNVQEQISTDEMRLVPFGNKLRASSLDELPELINVLKGEMSLIGPRPLLSEYLELYNEHQKKRHLVKPGISGYAQVNGRNSITWDEKFDLDVEYVENVSFIGDLKIILFTVKKVFQRDGINSQKSVTMEAFKGNRN